MNRSLLGKLSFCARYLLLHHLNRNPHPTPPLFSLPAFTRSIIPRFCCSKNNFPDEPSFTQSHNKDDPSHTEDVISNEELKKRIAKLEEGDTGAIPEIFEGILSRLLSGKPEEAHNELRKELLGEETESADDTEDEEFDSDEEGTSETDEQETSSNCNPLNR